MLRVWGGPDFRPTKDLDLLGFLQREADVLHETFATICRQPVDDDGLEFDSETIEVAEIREQQTYGGLRVIVTATLGNAVIPLQVDVGFGDAITPKATDEEYPAILDQPRPWIQAYPPETVVAEKYEAIVRFGMINTRMKDYYDLWFISRRFEFDGAQLSGAIGATFERRGTRVPDDAPVGLTREFAGDAAHVRQWAAFIVRVGGDAPRALGEVVDAARVFLLPPSRATASHTPFNALWAYGSWNN